MYVYECILLGFIIFVVILYYYDNVLIDLNNHGIEKNMTIDIIYR